MIQTVSLSFSYPDQAALLFPNLALEDQENLLIIGESGVGKTTLMHMISGILKPATGTVVINGTLLHELKQTEIDHYRGAHIGIVYQRPHFIQSLSIKENFLLVQFLGRRKQDVKEVQRVLQSLNLVQKINKLPNELSQGEQQRATIGMAVINHPAVILADEPTSNLDDKHCNQVIDLLLEQSSASQSHLIVITHDARLRSHFKQIVEL